MATIEEDNGKEDETLKVLSDVVHDMKGPVIAAKGFLELVGNMGELNEMQVKFLGRAGSAMDRMERMITTVLDFARLGTEDDLDLEPIDLYEIIMHEWGMMEGMAAPKEIHFELIGNPGEIVIDADRHYVSQIVYNLLINAINYNRDNGKIIVKLSKKLRRAQVEIADTGLGIEPDQQGQIFERFYRGYNKNSGSRPIQRGTGLGLAIAKAFVELHHGEIWVESTIDVGSTFTFTLPIKQSSSTKGSKKPKHTRLSALPNEESSEETDAVDDDSQESTHGGVNSVEFDSRGDEP